MGLLRRPQIADARQTSRKPQLGVAFLTGLCRSRPAGRKYIKLQTVIDILKGAMLNRTGRGGYGHGDLQEQSDNLLQRLDISTAYGSSSGKNFRTLL